MGLFVLRVANLNARHLFVGTQGSKFTKTIANARVFCDEDEEHLSEARHLQRSIREYEYGAVGVSREYL